MRSRGGHAANKVLQGSLSWQLLLGNFWEVGYSCHPPLPLPKQLRRSFIKAPLKRVTTFPRRPGVIEAFGESHYKNFARPSKTRKRTLSLPGGFQGRGVPRQGARKQRHPLPTRFMLCPGPVPPEWRFPVHSKLV